MDTDARIITMASVRYEPDERDDTREPEWAARHIRLPRRVKIPIKTCCAAIVLFTIGTFMLYYGIPEWWKGGAARERGTAMIVLGSLTFIPGSYATVQLYGAYQQWPGYRFDAIPSYDD